MNSCAAAGCARDIGCSASSQKAGASRAAFSTSRRRRMRERDVPQEGNATLEGKRKAVYAVGDDGRLRIVQSAGWEVEETVTRQALEELERRAQEALVRANAGQSSPLEYHMY